MPSKSSVLESLCTRKALLYFAFSFLGGFIFFTYLLMSPHVFLLCFLLPYSFEFPASSLVATSDLS